MLLNIRRMRELDIDQVYAIETDVHIAPWSKEILKDCVLVGYDCRVLEINNNNSLIMGGYIISRFTNESCHILNLSVAKPLQSRGFGRQLLQTLLYFLQKFTKINVVVLEVRPTNKAALHLYKSMGFVETEVKQGYYNDSAGIEDAVLLKKILRS